MSANYDLTSGLDEGFEFKATLKGKLHEYNVSYPSQKDLQPIQMGYSRIQEIDKEYAKLGEDEQDKKDKLVKETEKIAKEMNEAFNSLFTPKGDSMPVSDLIEQLPLPARKKWEEMIKNEFSIE